MHFKYKDADWLKVFGQKKINPAKSKHKEAGLA